MMMMMMSIGGHCFFFFSSSTSMITRSGGSSSSTVAAAGAAAAAAAWYTTTSLSLRRLHCVAAAGGGGGGTPFQCGFPVIDHVHRFHLQQQHDNLSHHHQRRGRRNMVTLMERATKLRQLAEQREQQEQGQQPETVEMMKVDATLDGNDDASYDKVANKQLQYDEGDGGGGDDGDDGDPAVMAIFDEIDMNDDGVISRDEFKIAIEKMRDLDLRRMKRSLAVNDIAMNYKGAALGRHVIVSEQFNAWQFIKCLPDYEHVKHLCPPVKLPPLEERDRSKQYTLVLDMDETLLHCSPDREESVHEPDHTFTISYQGRSFPVHAWLRPKLYDFLDKIHDSQKFEVVIFTVSQPEYANAMLDIIDPDHKYFQHRLFRDSCMNLVEGSGSSSSYVKDLNVLGRDLSKCILVDNSPHVFGYNLDNGIPISSWYDDRQDNELEKLEWFLRHVGEGRGGGGGGDDNDNTTTVDVRELIRQKFQCYKLVENAAGILEDDDNSNDGVASSEMSSQQHSTRNGSPIASASR